MADWEVTKGEYGWTQEFRVTQAQGGAFDLTGQAVTLAVLKLGVTKFTGNCTLDNDPKTGKCYYVPISTDFDTAGKYTWRLDLDTDTTHRTSKIKSLRVK
jgi:hypothetical protein